ncbi:MAG: 1,2-phenylacetyl-CoA epoxidase subunit PaaE [Saprospiraceae bacterium]
MPKFHSLEVINIRRETPECVSVAFAVPVHLQADFKYLAGQYLTLKTDIDGEEVRRSYSICTSPQEQELRVAIKKVEGGKFSTFANGQLRAETKMDVMTPTGKFQLKTDKANENHYVAFAAGSGITPIMAMIKTVLQAEPKSSFTLFYGNRGFDSIIFREELENLKNKNLGRLSIHHILSREHLGSDLFYGRIDEEKCNRFSKMLFDPQDIASFYLCGPEQMIRSASAALKEAGVDEEKIHFELFTSPVGNLGGETIVRKSRAKDKKVQSEITIILDGNSVKFPLDSDGETILDTALNNRMDLPFACKGGVCATCKAKILEGDVEMEVNYGLEPDEVEAGFVLTCQAHPLSDKVIVDFDV